MTVDDYKAIILQDYSSQIDAITVFGGENGDPNDPAERPLYGRVFIAIKPTGGQRLTESKKDNIIRNTVKPHSLVGVIPEIIDPDYVYLIITTQVKYDPRATTRTRSQLSTSIIDAVDAYAAQYIQKFNTSFRFSRLTRAIDDADAAISSSLTRIELQKRIFPILGVENSLVVKFGAPLYKNGSESVLLESTSHRFSYLDHNQIQQDNCFFREQNGIVDVVVYDENRVLQIVDNAVGSIDITTGVMRLANFAPQDIEGNAVDIWINALPATADLTPELNRMFYVDADTISVELFDENSTVSSAGFLQGGKLR